MKKIVVIVLTVVIIIGAGFGYFKYKINSVEKAVVNYLKTEEQVSEENIIVSDGFIANFPGEKKWMVAIKLNGDEKTYYYYKDEKNNVILESYIEKGLEHVVPDKK